MFNNFRSKQLVQKAQKLKNCGKPREAIRFYREALKLNPLNINAWVNLGNALDDIHCLEQSNLTEDEIGWSEELGWHDEPLYCFDMALKIDKTDCMAWFNKGVTLSNRKRNDEAIHCFEEFKKYVTPDQEARIAVAESVIDRINNPNNPKITIIIPNNASDWEMTMMLHNLEKNLKKSE